MTELTKPGQISTKFNLEKIESIFLKQPQVDCPVTHHFGPGTYTREVFMPAGTTVIGHHHNEEHLNIMVKGRILFATENGIVELRAPQILPGKTGRKIAKVLEDTVWLNVFSNPSNEQDVNNLENRLLTKSDAWNSDKLYRDKVLQIESFDDQKDFKKCLEEFGISEWTAQQISECDGDLTPFPYGSFKVKVSTSTIHGQGLFATGNFEPGELIAPARINGLHTKAGRFTNHSIKSNAQMVALPNGDINLVATSKIAGCLGGQDGQEILINYREALKLTMGIAKGDLKCLQSQSQ